MEELEKELFPKKPEANKREKLQMSNLIYSDQSKYSSNVLWNTKYLMRDVFSYSELEELVELGKDLIKEKKEGGYDE